jgi:hypothetical protein
VVRKGGHPGRGASSGVPAINLTRRLRPLPGSRANGPVHRGYRRCTPQPPANGCNPSGICVRDQGATTGYRKLSLRDGENCYAPVKSGSNKASGLTYSSAFPPKNAEDRSGSGWLGPPWAYRRLHWHPRRHYHKQQRKARFQQRRRLPGAAEPCWNVRSAHDGC